MGFGAPLSDGGDIAEAVIHSEGISIDEPADRDAQRENLVGHQLVRQHRRGGRILSRKIAVHDQKGPQRQAAFLVIAPDSTRRSCSSHFALREEPLSRSSC